ncbi:Chlorophyll a-b binding protein [Psidium guajava]|nr:Chlorophyll a-b binding protein [Psidium guajava]
MVGSVWSVTIAISTGESKREDHLFILPYNNIFTVRNQLRKNQTCNGQRWSKEDTWSAKIKEGNIYWRHNDDMDLDFLLSSISPAIIFCEEHSLRG